jgi:hypothetical protein
MASHSSHRLQPLDVSCFAPLKQIYGQQIQISMQLGINHIDKQGFLTTYQYARGRALSTAIVHSGFAATGLVPYNPQRVLDCLDISTKITPPTSSHGTGAWTAKAPYSTQEVQNQLQLIKHLVDRHSQSPPNQAIKQQAKGCEATMHEVIMLRQQVEELRAGTSTPEKEARSSQILYWYWRHSNRCSRPAACPGS